MSTYAFAGGKGGIGKTTTTLNVGVALAERGHEVVVVDADLGMTDLGRLLNVDTEPGIHGVLAGEVPPREAMVDGPAGTRILPGQAEIDALGRADPAKLPPVLDHLEDRADFVLVDTSAGLSHDVLVSLGAADGVVLLTTPKQTALGDAERTGELTDQVDGTVLGTVVTRARHDTDLDRIASETGTAVVSAVAEDPTVTERAVVDEEARSWVGYRHLADALEVASGADDPVAAAQSLEPPELPDPLEPDEPADRPATATVQADAEEEDEEDQEDGGTVSEVISGLFASDESGF